MFVSSYIQFIARVSVTAGFFAGDDFVAVGDDGIACGVGLQGRLKLFECAFGQQSYAVEALFRLMRIYVKTVCLRLGFQRL